MSEDKRISRRALLFLDRKEATPQRVEPVSGGFSLDAFYAKRAESGESRGALPVFRMREGLAAVATTSVGTPELAEGVPERQALANLSVFAGRTQAPAVPVAAPLRLLRDHCLAWQRSFCTVCSERCPEPGAIVLDQGRPILVEERCTRCGECIAACPAPINAFELAIGPNGSPGSVA